MQLREYIEQVTQYDDTLSIEEKIEIGRKKLFNFSYPIFDEAYRKIFETHFIRHFYMREIGYETEGLFKFNLQTWLMIHMPYFNKLFESELITFNPLHNTEVDNTHTKKNDLSRDDVRDIVSDMLANEKANSVTDQTSNTEGTSKTDTEEESHADEDASETSNTNTTDDNFARNLRSDTPDSRLTITSNDGEGVIEYASEIKEQNEKNESDSDTTKDGTKTTDTTGTSSSDSSMTTDSESNQQSEMERDNTQNVKSNDQLNSEINEIEDFVAYRVGKIGVQSYSKMVMEFRQTFIRIEQGIFHEMNQLFMLVY